MFKGILKDQNVQTSIGVVIILLIFGSFILPEWMSNNCATSCHEARKKEEADAERKAIADAAAAVQRRGVDGAGHRFPHRGRDRRGTRERERRHMRPGPARA